MVDVARTRLSCAVPADETVAYSTFQYEFCIYQDVQCILLRSSLGRAGACVSELDCDLKTWNYKLLMISKTLHS